MDHAVRLTKDHERYEDMRKRGLIDDEGRPVDWMVEAAIRNDDVRYLWVREMAGGKQEQTCRLADVCHSDTPCNYCIPNTR